MDEHGLGIHAQARDEGRCDAPHAPAGDHPDHRLRSRPQLDEPLDVRLDLDVRAALSVPRADREHALPRDPDAAFDEGHVIGGQGVDLHAHGLAVRVRGVEDPRRRLSGPEESRDAPPHAPTRPVSPNNPLAAAKPLTYGRFRPPGWDDGTETVRRPPAWIR